MRSLGPKRVFEDVIQRIRLDIARGQVKPGDKMPPDRDLAAAFGIGRGSIREAIRALELFGLVSVKRGRDGGVFFTPECRELARASFAPMSVMKTTLGDSLEFRKAIEPKAAGLAALRATREDVVKLQQSIAMMEGELASAEVFIESNRLFHEAIAQATRNPYFQDFIPEFLARPEVVHATGAAETIQRSLTRFFHTRIADAITKQDAEMAEFWMQGHLSQIDEDLAHAQEATQKKPPRKPRG
jgi:GntR family transcriptional regulator, transcriptional repressor for pyruvate dehydrogenase complex